MLSPEYLKCSVSETEELNLQLYLIFIYSNLISHLQLLVRGYSVGCCVPAPFLPCLSRPECLWPGRHFTQHTLHWLVNFRVPPSRCLGRCASSCHLFSWLPPYCVWSVSKLTIKANHKWSWNLQLLSFSIEATIFSLTYSLLSKQYKYGSISIWESVFKSNISECI